MGFNGQRSEVPDVHSPELTPQTAAMPLGRCGPPLVGSTTSSPTTTTAAIAALIPILRLRRPRPASRYSDISDELNHLAPDDRDGRTLVAVQYGRGAGDDVLGTAAVAQIHDV